MNEPKPYPPTDQAEQQTLAVFLNLIDDRFVKADIRTRDKYPNYDGTVELVNEHQVPLGKLDIQLRTIGDGLTKYSCPVSLVAYSTKSTLPVLLVCIDPSTKRAFWRHVGRAMPECKENQESFTIHFSIPSDLIDQTGSYLQRWTEIVRDYQERIAKFPILRAEVANKLILEGIEGSDRELFQRFIDTVNDFLDNHFIVIKELLFPGVWKLGVGIISSDKSHLQYQIYAIPYQEPSPLVCKLNRGLTDQRSPNVLYEFFSSRDRLANPLEAGKDFVLREVRTTIEHRGLPVYGHMLAEDVLIAFVDLYHRLLGLNPDLDSYMVRDLAFALNQYLIQMGAAIVTKIARGHSAGFIVDLDWFADYLRTTNIDPLTPGHTTVYFSFVSRSFPIKYAFESLQYLLANQITEIHRPFAKRDLTISPGVNWVWSAYTREDEINSVARILNHCLDEYTAFVHGNRLRFSNSPYLDSNTSIIFEYEPAKPGSTSYFDGPGLREHHVDNTDHALPKLSFFVRDKDQHRVDTSKFPNIEIDGSLHTAYSSSDSVASFLFQRTPVLNMIYRMLSHDLSHHYSMTVSPAIFY